MLLSIVGEVPVSRATSGSLSGNMDGRAGRMLPGEIQPRGEGTGSSGQENGNWKRN